MQQSCKVLMSMLISSVGNELEIHFPPFHMCWLNITFRYLICYFFEAVKSHATLSHEQFDVAYIDMGINYPFHMYPARYLV